MEELENYFRSKFLNKKLTEIEFYNTNDQFYVFNEDSKWVVDGGVQINFGDEVFSYGWETDFEGYNYSFEKSFEELIGESDQYAIGAKDVKGISNLIGKTVTNLALKWQFYQEYDEEGELKDEKTFVPVELIIQFDFEDLLHFALIDFGIDMETNNIENAVYDLGGNMLLSINNETEINIYQEE